MTTTFMQPTYLQDCYEYAAHLLVLLDAKKPITRAELRDKAQKLGYISNGTGDWLGLGLTALKKSGFANNPTRGSWVATSDGIRAISHFSSEGLKEHLAFNFRRQMSGRKRTIQQ